MNEKSSKQMRTFEDKYKYNYTLLKDVLFLKPPPLESKILENPYS